LRPPYDTLAGRTSPAQLWAAFVEDDSSARAAAAPALRDYDFIVFADRDPFAVPADACLTPVSSTPRFQLFALKPGCF
jgi:hypothetical protein